MSKQYLCPFPGCMSIVGTQGRYCAAHAGLQEEKDRKAREFVAKRWEQHHARIDYSWIWNTVRWRKLRASHLKREPMCRRCGDKANTVDHIEPHRGSMDLAFNANNLQSLCARCSNVKSREDRNVVPTHTPPGK